MFQQANEWQQTIQSWVTADLNHPVLAVKYEDLRLDTVAELERVLDFLQTPYSTLILEELALNIQEDNLSVVYTTDQRHYVNSIIKSTIETLATLKVDSELLDLSSYLKL